MGWSIAKKDDGSDFSDRMKELRDAVLGASNVPL
jgi:hypothetical protein